MIRTHKTTFRTNKKDMERLFACNHISAQVWNDCLEHVKNHHQQTGRWINLSRLQQLTRKKYHLHSQSVQSVQERYLQARRNAWKARQKGFKDIRYPYKEKKRYPTRWKKDGFVVYPDGLIELKMCLINGKRQPPIMVKAADIPKGQIKEIELVWDRKLMLAISYEDGRQPKENNNQCVAAIDMGEIHGSTQTCPVCDRKKKVSGRTYRCYCGYVEHRDIHGAKAYH